MRGGLTFRYVSDRDYSPRCNDPRIAAKLIKPRATPQMVALGNFDVGFCGLDILLDAAYDDAIPVFDLGLNPVKIVVAVPKGKEYVLTNPPKRPLLIATEYERIADNWAMARGLAHITIQTHGSTEAYAPEDADIVFDCRETGLTLDANNLVVIEELLNSTTHLIANRRALNDANRKETIEDLKKILEQVKTGYYHEH